MKLSWYVGTVLVLQLTASGEASAQVAGVHRGPYFGQPSPGTTPALFVPERFRDPGEYHSPPVFSPDGTEVYWSPMPGHGEPTTLASRVVEGAWSDQAYVDFGLDGGATEVTFSPDGRRVFFLSLERMAGEESAQGDRGVAERIWYVDRIPGGFASPRPVGGPVWRHPTHWAFSVAAGGNLYFTSQASEVRGGADIYMAPFDGTTWGEPRPLGPGVNSGVAENCPFIAPDESYLLFTRIDQANYNPDLFISQRLPDGSWSEAVPLPAPINSDATEIYPVVSPDGRYLFFLSWREGAGRPFWVEADFLRGR
jgi:Tol biopolymer transport system component